jgi:SAM domain (Sterile alpha motif)
MSATAAKEISDWLEKLGLAQYAERFAQNYIFPSFLIARIKDIGLRHRRQLLRAIPNS